MSVPSRFYPTPPLGNPRLACRLIYKPVFPVEFLRFLRSIIREDKWKEAAVGPHNQHQPEIRKTLQQPLPQQHCQPILETLIPHLQAANNELWRFDLTGFDLRQDPPNILSYPQGSHYNWHVDFGRSLSTRKLSFVIPISASDNYQGGDLEVFPPLSAQETEECRHPGTLIIFPAYVPHRITAVTKGRRLSLVGWVHGPAFR